MTGARVDDRRPDPGPVDGLVELLDDLRQYVHRATCDGELAMAESIDEAAAALKAQAAKIAELEAANDRLRLAVQQAGNAFYNYAQSHAAKGTPEADEKAKRNRDLCAIMDAALKEPRDG